MATKPGDPVRMPQKGPRPKPNEERFAAKVDKSQTCWVWTGARVYYHHKNGTSYGGYGSFSVRTPGIRGHKGVLAHRFAWELAHGPIPDGVDILHHCDNPPCVKTEPDENYPEGHLFAGTASDNSRDMVAKGHHGKTTKPTAWSPERHWTHVHPERVIRGAAHARNGAKLTVEQVREIRAAKGPYPSIAKGFGIAANTVYQIKAGRTWDYPEAYPDE